MHFDERLGQRQAKAGALILTVEIAVDLLERRQRPPDVLLGHPDAGIGDHQPQTAVGFELGKGGKRNVGT